jgi:tetratricopeptide (TPR) repeat protein
MDDHPSLETLARWLAGEMEHEEVLREVVPHLVASCPVCRGLQAEIRRLQEESGHWSEVVAVLETREAPELASLLLGRPHEEQVRLVMENESLHTWGLCQYFLRLSQEAVFQDPVRSVDMAHLAVRLSAHLGEAYHPDSVANLRARAYAWLGNARRVLGELKAAEHAFTQAEEHLRGSGDEDLRIQAEVFFLKASLRLDQRRLDEAPALIDSSLGLFRQSQDLPGPVKAVLNKAKILQVRGDLDRAIDLLHENATVFEEAGDPRLKANARQSLLSFLTLAGRHEEAQRLLPEVQDLFRKSGEPTDLIKLRWAEASIAQGLGKPEEAEALYREVRSALLDLGKGYDAALVSLDLAALLAEQGRTAELKPLAVEILAAFDARSVDREALASFLLFQQACAEERATLAMIRNLATLLHRTRPAESK